MISTPASSSIAKTRRLPSSTSKVPTPSTSNSGTAPPLVSGVDQQRGCLRSRTLDQLHQLLSFPVDPAGRRRETYGPFHLPTPALDRRSKTAKVLGELLEVRGVKASSPWSSMYPCTNSDPAPASSTLPRASACDAPWNPSNTPTQDRFFGALAWVTTASPSESTAAYACLWARRASSSTTGSILTSKSLLVPLLSSGIVGPIL